MRELNEWEKTLDKDVFKSKEADAVGAFSITEASGFTGWDDKLRFIKEYCLEKDPAKLFPGPHFGEFGMNLLPAFKRELAVKASDMCGSLLTGSELSLRWTMAKALVADEKLYENVQDVLVENEPIARIVEAARTFTP